MPRALVAFLLFLLLAGGPAAGAILPPGQPLTAAVVAPLLEQALRSAVGGERHEITIESPALPMANPAGRPAALELLGFTPEPRGRFRASLHVRLDTGEESTIPLLGRSRPLVAIVVPARRVERGQPLGVEMLDLRWVPDGPAMADALRDPAALAGRVARRPLSMGRAIRAADLEAERMVRRGEAVTLVYGLGGLEVSTIGEALDEGGQGALVRVLNPATRLVRRGTVAGHRLVRVTGVKEAGR